MRKLWDSTGIFDDLFTTELSYAEIICIYSNIPSLSFLKSIQRLSHPICASGGFQSLSSKS